MFYDAMIADGVSKPKALAMYYAVHRLGPRWVAEKRYFCSPSPAVGCMGGAKVHVRNLTASPVFSKREFESEVKELLNGNFSLREIEIIANQRVMEIGAKMKISGVVGTDFFNDESGFENKFTYENVDKTFEIKNDPDLPYLMHLWR